MLTTRQWKLYNLLKTQPDKWWSMKEICECIAEYHYTDDDRNPCVDIGTDRIIINADMEIDKIITVEKHCFKIATREEYAKERARHIARIKNEVAQVQAQDKKYERDGQGKLFNNILEELKPQNEQYHETFVAPKGVYARVFVNLQDKVVYKVFMTKYEFDEDNHIVYYINKDGQRRALLNIAQNRPQETFDDVYYDTFTKKEII